MPIEALENLAVFLIFLVLFGFIVLAILVLFAFSQSKETQEIEAKYHEALAQLLHCQAYDETSSHREFGQHIVWDGLSKAEKAYWMALVNEEPEPGGQESG